MDPIERERDIDQWLERALSQYGKVEPRAGLESRVLANLQAERNRIVSRRRWWWAAGAIVAAAAIVAAVWLGEAGRTKNPPTRAGSSTAAPGETARAPVPQSPQQPIRHQAKATPGSRPRARAVRDLEVVQGPKRGQFPSPSPLSDQEKMLARYVQEFPHRAVLLARAQTELRKRDELEMAAPWPKDAGSTSLEQPQ